MRIAAWLDQLLERSSRARTRGTLERRSRAWRLAAAECLEDRLQPTALTYSATDLPLNVPPDGADSIGSVVSTIQVADHFLVQDVNVQLNIQHTWAADLDAVLISPNGKQVQLFQNIGGSEDNFSGTIFDQQASRRISKGQAPFTGTFRPSENLASLNGQDSQGFWQLKIADNYYLADSGTLLSWSLTLNDIPPEQSLVDVAVPLLVAIDQRTSVSGAITLPSDVVAYAIDLQAGGFLQFDVAPAQSATALQPLIRVFDESLSELPVTQTVISGDQRVVLPVPVDGRYFIAVSSALGDTGTPYDPHTVQHGNGVSVGAYTAHASVSYVNLQPTTQTALYDLTASRSGVLQVSISGTNGTPFVGNVSLLTRDLRLLYEQAFDGTPITRQTQFADVIGQGNYLLRVTPSNEVQETWEVHSTLVPAANPLVPIPFQSLSPYATPTSVQVVDVNGDHRADLVAVKQAKYDESYNQISSGGVSVQLGRGNGTFQPEELVPVSDFGEYGNSVQVIDVNGDHHPDLIAMSSYGYYDENTQQLRGTVSVLLGRGDGTFDSNPSEQALLVGEYPQSIQVVDVNGDSHLDLVTLNSGSYDFTLQRYTDPSVSVLLARGDGTFQSDRRSPLSELPQSVQVVDVNGDGHLDLATVNAGDHDSQYYLVNSSVSVLIGHGDGTFESSEQRTSVPLENSYSLVAQIMDVNGDGRGDLIVADPGRLDQVYYQYLDPHVSVRFGQADGFFGIEQQFEVGLYPALVRVEDINKDGRLDLITLNQYSDDVSVLLGIGDGASRTFGTEQRFRVGTYPQDLQIEDVNRDGALDLVTANYFSKDVSVLLGDGQGAFSSGRQFAIGAYPRTVQLLDVNGDGLLDVFAEDPGSYDYATRQYLSATISVLLGNGDGSLQTQQRFDVGRNSGYLQVADLNGDGHVDLITANFGTYNYKTKQYDDSSVSVLLGRSDGSFEKERRFRIGELPSTLQIVDYNGDGRVDIVTGDSVLFGRGDGTFQSEQPLLVSRSTVAVQVIDLNGDQRTDIVTLTQFELDDRNRQSSHGFVSVRLGSTGGAYGPEQRFAVGETPALVQVVDVNGDHVLDLVVINAGHYDETLKQSVNGSVSVFLGQGNGAFDTEQRLSVGESPQSAVVVDVNGDGWLDLVTSNTGHYNNQYDQDRDQYAVVGSSVSVLLGNEHGIFAAAQGTATPVENSWSLIAHVMDLNGDGRGDLIVVDPGRYLPYDPSDPTSGRYIDPHVSVRMGQADGFFADEQTFEVGLYPTSVHVADVDQDGRPDLITTNAYSGDISVLLGHGDGTFESQRRFVVGSFPFDVQLIDVNGDGYLDFVTPNSSSNDVTVLLNNFGKQALSQTAFVNSQSVAPTLVGERPAIVDVDNDGLDDVLLLSSHGELLFRKGLSSNEFATAMVINPNGPVQDFTVLQSKSGVQIASINRDGTSISLVQWLDATSTREGGFTEVGTVALHSSGLAQIAAGNFDHDPARSNAPATLDEDFIVLDHGVQTVTFYLAVATGFRQAETLHTGNGPVALTVSDLNHDGFADILVPNSGSGDVSAFTNTGNGHFTTSLIRAGSSPFFIGSSPYDSAKIESQSFEGTSSAEVGYFNDDRFPDVITTNPGSNSFSILYGTEHGLSSKPTVTLLGATPEPSIRSVFVGPIEADHVLQSDHKAASISGSISGSISHLAAVRVADINHDGHDDAVFLNESGSELSVFLNSEDLSGKWALRLTTTVELPTPFTGFTLHAASSNALPDLYGTNEFGDLVLLINQGGGQFAEYRHADVNVPIAVQDLNHDGKLDVVLANQQQDQVSIDYGGADHPTDLKEFASSTSGVSAPGAVKLADLTNDGVADLLVLNTGGNSILIYKGNVGLNGLGDGTFARGESIFTGSNPSSVLVSDLDHDGLMDLIVTNRGSNTVASFYGQATHDSQTMVGATEIPFRAGAISRLPSGSGPVDAQVVSGKSSDGSMQTALVVTNNIGNSVSFFASAGNGIFSLTPSNTVQLDFSPLPGALINNGSVLVLPNYEGNSLSFVSVTSSVFGSSQPDISSSSTGFDHPVGLSVSDVNQDGHFDLFVLLVANNGNSSVSLLMGDGNSFDYSGSRLLDGITHASAMQVVGLELYVTEQGQDIFSVFELADLRFANGDQILDFEEITNSVASTNRPIYGLGKFSSLLIAMLGNNPLEEGETRDASNIVREPVSWQTFVVVVTQFTQQLDQLSEIFCNGLLRSMLETLGADLGLPTLSNKPISQATLETLATPLRVLSGTQPLTQLVRTLRSLWPIRSNAPMARPSSSTPPATKPPPKIPMKTAPAQSSAAPNSIRTPVSLADPASPLLNSTSQKSQHAQRSDLINYLAQLTTNPNLASELFDHQSKFSQDISLTSIEEDSDSEAITIWRTLALSWFVLPTSTEVYPHRLRNRRSHNKTVG